MRATRAAWGASAACAVVLALAGCGDDGGTAPVTAAPSASTPAGSRLAGGDAGLAVAGILADTTGEPLLVRAFVVVSPDGTARLCDLLAESSPPQCGGASIPVTGLPPEMVAGLAERAGVRWSDQPVQLIGAVRDGTFVNDPRALAAS